MSQDWVAATIGSGGASRPSKAVIESKNLKHGSVRRVIGEEDAPGESFLDYTNDSEPDTEPFVPDLDAHLSSGVQALASAWVSGDKMTVAQRVLGGLPSYTDLVALFFTLGDTEATELARLMDSMDSENPDEDPSVPGVNGVPLEQPGDEL